MQRNLIFLACFFICAAALGQLAESSAQYPFVHYTPKDGLINSRVKKAYQDSKGRMYFLTYGGLSVFDGARFKNYTRETGLATDVVNDIIEVGDDSLLVATNSEHFLNVLVKGKLGVLKTEGVSCGTVNQFYLHDNSHIYLASDNGLFILEDHKPRELNISFLKTIRSELPYLANIAGQGNYLLLSTHELRDRKGLYLYDIRNNRICDALPELTLNLLGKDKSNNIWIAMGDELYTLDRNSFVNGKLLLTSPGGGYRQLKGHSSTNVAFDKNSIWLVQRNKNDRNIEIHRADETGVLSRILLPGQTASSDIRNILIDKENIIWLCNDGEGVFKIVNSPMQIFENPFGKAPEDRSNNHFYSNHVSWHTGPLNKLFRRSGNELQVWDCNLERAPMLFRENEAEMLAQDDRNIYSARRDDEKKFLYFRKIISLPDSDLFLGQTRLDRYGSIITSQKNGLVIWRNNKSISHWPLSRNDVNEELVFDKDNLLWVVKRYTGIIVFSLHPEDPANYLKPVYTFLPEQITGSPRCFVIDKMGMIWIGTRDHGLIGYRLERNRLTKLYHFDADNGLTDNFVTTIACDSANNIIVGTQTGLDRIVMDSASYRIENLSKTSNFFAFIKKAWAEDSLSYALTNSGILLQLSPLPKANKNGIPKLILEEVKVNAQTVSEKKQKFRHKENNISFLVAAPSFIDEKQVAYSYLLEGSQNDQWSDTTPANSVINLANLSAGDYSLRVKAFFPSTSYHPAELFYPFHIAPPWWQTWWFRSFVAVFIIGLLVAGIQFYYRRKLEKQMAIFEKQQAIEKERTRIATDMHDDLGAGLSRIKFLSENVKASKGNSETMLKDIEKISAYSDEMAAKMGEIVWALNEKNDTVADLVAFTRSYVQEYLSGRNIHCELNTPIELPSTFITGEMRQHIFLSVKECLHNIVKHAGASQVYFSVKLNGEIEIVIHDNGRGIDLNSVRPFSNGIQNIQKRMHEIHGKVVFLNKEGTKVILSIPHEL